MKTTINDTETGTMEEEQLPQPLTEHSTPEQPDPFDDMFAGCADAPDGDDVPDGDELAGIDQDRGDDGAGARAVPAQSAAFSPADPPRGELAGGPVIYRTAAEESTYRATGPARYRYHDVWVGCRPCDHSGPLQVVVRYRTDKKVAVTGELGHAWAGLVARADVERALLTWYDPKPGVGGQSSTPQQVAHRYLRMARGVIAALRLRGHIPPRASGEGVQ